MRIVKTALAGMLLAGTIAGAGPAAAQGNLNLYVWAESINPALIEKFEAETGIDVSVDSYTSNEDLLTKLKSGATGYDVVMPSQHFVAIMIQEGLLEDIDADAMQAFAAVDDRWKKQWWDPEGQYSIPFAYGSSGYTVNRDKYDGPVDSWKHFFEPPEEAKGSIAVFATPDEIISAAQNYLGIEYCSENPDEMKRVLDLLMAQKPDVATYSNDNIGSRVGGGEVAMHSWWDGDTLRARMNDGANIEYASPKEGLVGWLDSFVVPKGAPNIDNAKRFIEFMSTEANATEQYNFYAHGSPLKIDTAQAKYTPENAPELFPTVPVNFSKACSPEAQKLVDRVWTQLLQ
jgi:spermidine/putrescine transport system substrate-binding protein